MHQIESKRGMLALMTAHCAGMVDLVALPVWIGTLVAHYHFDFQQAGGLVTLFLLSAMVASLLFAPLFNKFTPKWPVLIGFTSACCAFYLASNNTQFPILAILHVIGGFSAGLSLSFTHGTIGRSRNPHRTFGFAGLALGIFAILFLGGSMNLIKSFGGSIFFIILAVVMAIAALTALLFYPHITKDKLQNYPLDTYQRPNFSKYIWCCIFGISLLAMTNSMNTSFYERIGMERGFGQSAVAFSLIIYGIVSVFPAPIAAFTQKYLNPFTVICIGPIFQAVFSLLLSHTDNYILYTIAGSCMVSTILFTHTYAFGLLAKYEPTGRAVAGTPAMLMFGAALGPILGGTLVKYINFEALGYMTCILVIAQIVLFTLLKKNSQQIQLAPQT